MEASTKNLFCRTRLKIRLYLLILTSVFALCSGQSVADNLSESNIEFAKRYIKTVDKSTPSEVYTAFWGARANQYVLKSPERISREIRNSAVMHLVVLNDKTLSTLPEINNWDDASMTTTFLFTLNKPVIVSLPGYPKSGDAPWTGYQITVERENKQWVVSGESLSR